MTKYIVFYGNNYYPSGGFDDNYESFDTEKEAIAFMKGLKAEDDTKFCNITEIVVEDNNIKFNRKYSSNKRL